MKSEIWSITYWDPGTEVNAFSINTFAWSDGFNFFPTSFTEQILQTFKVPFSRKKALEDRQDIPASVKGFEMQEAQSPRDTNFSIFLMERGKQTAAAELKKAHACHAAGLGTGQGAGKHGILRKSEEELSILTGFHWERVLQHCLRLDNIRLHEIRSAVSHFLPNFY